MNKGSILNTRANMATLSLKREENKEAIEKQSALLTELEERLDQAIADKDEAQLEEIRAESEKAAEELAKLDKKRQEMDAKWQELSELIEQFTADTREATAQEQEHEDTTEEDRGQTKDAKAERNISMKVHETRAEALNREENKRFLDAVAKAVRGESITNLDLAVPQYFETRIQDKAAEISKLYKEVHVIRFDGKIRLIYAGGGFKAQWTEKCATLKELEALNLNAIDLDAFKLGGFVAVCRYMAEGNNYEPLADLIERELAVGIAKALDDAILNGKGADQKQPEGILTKADIHKVEGADLTGLLASVGTVGTQEGADDLLMDELIAVMSRATFYKHIVPATLNSNQMGGLVVASEDGYVLPNGLRVVLTPYAPLDKVLLGDFKNGYVMGERRGVEIRKSEHAQFVEDNIVFAGTALYDGKVVNPKYFALVTLKEQAAEPSPVSRGGRR